MAYSNIATQGCVHAGVADNAAVADGVAVADTADPYNASHNGIVNFFRLTQIKGYHLIQIIR